MPVSLGLDDNSQQHLISLVLQSKNALQHGEQLCTRARTASNTSAQAAVDVLALDAKIKWMVEAVVEQLKVRILRRLVIGIHRRVFQLAASVARSIEDKRAHLIKQIDVRHCSIRTESSALIIFLVFRNGMHPEQNMLTNWM